MNILGLSCFYHDAAACLLVDGRIAAAVEEERLSRRKHDSRFPRLAIASCLEQAGLRMGDIDAVVFYEKPSRKLDRTLRIAKRYQDRAGDMFLGQLGQLLSEGLVLEEVLRRETGYGGPVHYSEHHLSHAASAFLVSPFRRAAVLTVDGVGEWSTTAQFLGDVNGLRALRQIDFPHSLGMLYAVLTAYLGFKVNNDEYKVMGLASYGRPSFRQAFEKLLTLHGDGSFSLGLDYFSFMYESDRLHTDLLEELLGPPRREDTPIEPRHLDIAASLQLATEEAVVALASSLRDLTGADDLCMAGGVAYNCVANSRVQERAGFRNVFVQPAAGDSGGAIGAALAYWYATAGAERVPAAYDTCLGPAFTDGEIRAQLERRCLAFEHFPEEAALCARAAALIRDDFIVGWFQGRLEFGPRALGSRSILANPCNPEMKDILNARVKFREDFRPFAPAVIEERAAEFFELAGPSPYMLFTPRVRPERAEDIPSVTHVDGTARVQTVARDAQPRFHRLIEEFGVLTGVPVVINTSFNVRGEPIVATPHQAVNCFLTTDIDYLVIGDHIVSKTPPERLR